MAPGSGQAGRTQEKSFGLEQGSPSTSDGLRWGRAGGGGYGTGLVLADIRTPVLSSQAPPLLTLFLPSKAAHWICFHVDDPLGGGLSGLLWGSSGTGALGWFPPRVYSSPIPPAYSSIHPSPIYLPTYPPIYSSSTHPPVYPPAILYPFIYHLIHLPLVYLPTHPSLYSSIHPSIH